MSDIVDQAAECTEQYLDAGIQAARQPIPPGEPGECDDCGHESPRLVAGRCAFCRDGRVRP